MRKLTLYIAAAASALIAASPAAAQNWGAPPQPGYGAPYGNAYGYDNRGQARALEVRAQQLRQQIHALHSRGRLSNSEVRRLDRHANNLQQRIRAASYRGLNRTERQDLERRLASLREAIRYESRDGSRWGWDGSNGSGNAYGYYGQRRDDDRRGRRGNDDDRRWDSNDNDDDRRGRRDRDDD